MIENLVIYTQTSSSIWLIEFPYEISTHISCSMYIISVHFPEEIWLFINGLTGWPTFIVESGLEKENLNLDENLAEW